MTDHNEALRLAEILEGGSPQFNHEAAALLRQQAEQIDQLRAEVERLRAIGSQLANVAFNWSQEANGTGQKLSAEDRALLKSLQTQWDAARTTHKETE